MFYVTVEAAAMATIKAIATIRIAMTARLVHAPTISWSRVESSLGNLQPGDHLPKWGEAHAVQPAVVRVVDENLGGYPDIVTCSAAPAIPTTVWHDLAGARVRARRGEADAALRVAPNHWIIQDWAVQPLVVLLLRAGDPKLEDETRNYAKKRAVVVESVLEINKGSSKVLKTRTNRYF